jgi:hypothetical protein
MCAIITSKASHGEPSCVEAPSISRKSLFLSGVHQKKLGPPEIIALGFGELTRNLSAICDAFHSST